jgi:hypothetical protein
MPRPAAEAIDKGADHSCKQEKTESGIEVLNPKANSIVLLLMAERPLKLHTCGR